MRIKNIKFNELNLTEVITMLDKKIYYQMKC